MIIVILIRNIFDMSLFISLPEKDDISSLVVTHDFQSKPGRYFYNHTMQ